MGLTPMLSRWAAQPVPQRQRVKPNVTWLHGYQACNPKLQVACNIHIYRYRYRYIYFLCLSKCCRWTTRQPLLETFCWRFLTTTSHFDNFDRFFLRTVIKVTPVDYPLTWGALSLPPRVAGPSLAPEEQKEPLPAWRFLVLINWARGFYMLSSIWRERERVIRRYQQRRVAQEGGRASATIYTCRMYFNYIYNHTLLPLSLLHASLSLSKATKPQSMTLTWLYYPSEWGTAKAWVSRVLWIGHGCSNCDKHNRARRRKREA